jgi:hypothetical protein
MALQGRDDCVQEQDWLSLGIQVIVINSPGTGDCPQEQDWLSIGIQVTINNSPGTRLSINIFRLRVLTFMYDGEHLNIVSLDLVKNAVSVDRELSHIRITEFGRHLADTGQFFEDCDFGADLLGNSFSLGR